MKRGVTLLLLLTPWLSALALDNNGIREVHLSYSIDQEAHERIIDTARNRSAVRFSEAVALAETTLKRRSDVDGLLALSRVKRDMEKNPGRLPYRPNANNLPTLSAYHKLVSGERDAIVSKHQNEMAEQRRSYANQLRRSLDQSGTPEEDRKLLRSYLTAVEGASISSSPSPSPRTSKRERMSEKAANLLRSCVPMILRDGKWVDADWESDIQYNETPKGNLRFSLRENAGHIYGRIRHVAPLRSGTTFHLTGLGIRTVEVIDKTQPDYTIFWYLQKPTRLAKFDFSFEGNRFHLSDSGHRLEPLTLMDTVHLKGKTALEDGLLTPLPQSPLYPAFSLSREHAIILMGWENPSNK